jgi:acetylornithine deacetylase/succinyl-diaminopimelate desuccinylase-like protein
MVLGPGDIKQAHTIDEWVELSQLEAIFHLYEKVVNA